MPAIVRHGTGRRPRILGIDRTREPERRAARRYRAPVATRRRNPGRVLIVAGVLIVAINLLVLGGLMQSTDTNTVDLPLAIERVLPEAGTVIRPQDSIGVDLRDGYTGQLTIDPPNDLALTLGPDQIEGDPNLGVVTFRPGAGKDIEEFSPGDHVAIVEYWPNTMTFVEADDAGDVGRYSWSFRVG
jgi:hypothetical protein